MSSDSILLISQEIKFQKYYLSTLGANVAAFSIGTVLGYCSPGIYSLNQPTSRIHLQPYQQSWFASLVPLAALIGGLIAGKTIELAGRKSTLILSSIPMIIGWLIITYAQDVCTLLIGRFITGLALGLSNLAGPVYIAETTPPKSRGLFGLSFPLSICLGVVYSYALGYIHNWSYLALYCSIVPAIQMLFMLFLPETPAYLIKNNQYDLATDSVIFLFGLDHNLSTTALALNSADHIDDNASFKLFTQARYRTPFILCLVVMFFQQFSGYSALLFFASYILESAKSPINPMAATIYIGLVQFFTVFISCFMVDRFGRKLLFYFSGLLMGLSMMTFSLYYFINETIRQNFGSIPLISSIVFIFAFSIGYGPVPWLLMSELIPSKVKGLASGLVTSFNFACTFLITLGFQYFAKMIDFKFIYLAFSLISFSSVLFVYFFLPESRGKSLPEIEEYFRQQNTNREAVYLSNSLDNSSIDE